MDKYYTPKIEELFVGYECEVESGEKWTKHILKGISETEGFINTENSDYYINTYSDVLNNIRTKYLDKEDIEKEGWEFQDQNLYKTYFIKKDKDIIYTLEFFKPHTTPYIFIKDNSTIINSKKVESIRYLGKAKSINEFRKIIEFTYQLGK